MAEKIINGKKPLSSKPSVSSIAPPEEFGNALSLSPELKKELADQGLEGRFINAKQLYDFQGYHPKGWVPYKRKVSDTLNSTDFIKGSDPSGIIRRGDCILATKSVAQAEKHRQFLQQKADREKGHTKDVAKALRSMGAPLNAVVDEGYDKQSDDAED